MEKITSLDELINWNNRYYTGLSFIHETDESKYPNINEWFLDWFFKEALKNIDIAKKAFDEYVNLTFICSDLNMYCALGVCLSNLNYWYNRASYYNSRKNAFKRFKAECL